jgi:hypothetical protein
MQLPRESLYTYPKMRNRLAVESSSAKRFRFNARKSRAAEPYRAFAGSVSFYCFLMLFLAVLMNLPNDLSFFRFST